eukprot:c6663_g1_i1.p1 GENE.c6663_g1_i1~~c6663_g1_i1.p1  ORF type:complete len:169 (+),score=37.42 c6663_g1_i1:46-507(+)
MGGHDETGCVQRAAETGLFGGFLGAIGGSVLMFWDMPKITSKDVIVATHHSPRVVGRYSLVLGAVGVLYSGVQCTMEKTRDSKDMWNGVAASAATGALLGLQDRSLRRSINFAAAMAVVSVVFHYFEGKGRPELDHSKHFPYHPIKSANQDEE